MVEISESHSEQFLSSRPGSSNSSESRSQESQAPLTYPLSSTRTFRDTTPCRYFRPLLKNSQVTVRAILGLQRYPYESEIRVHQQKLDCPKQTDQAVLSV